MRSLDSMKEPQQLEDLKRDVLDLLDMSQEFLNDKLKTEQNQKKIVERIHYLESARKAIINIFKVMNLIHNSKKDFDNGILQKQEAVN